MKSSRDMVPAMAGMPLEPAPLTPWQPWQAPASNVASCAPAVAGADRATATAAAPAFQDIPLPPNERLFEFRPQH
jgi:hypothetical protein